MRDQEAQTKRNFVRVTIRVEDVNDHSPHFIRSVYEASVSDSSAAETEVLQVHATDKDQGLNAQIQYSIQSGECFIRNIYCDFLTYLKGLSLNIFKHPRTL